MGKDTILILIICSYHKNQHGVNNIHESSLFNWNTSILNQLSDSIAETLQKKRKEVYDLLKSGKIFWHNIDENGHPFNTGLVLSREFGADEDSSARYLPAIYRYHGRFYKELGDNGRVILSDTTVHVLILSGLYGFVTPTELIQLYSVPIEWGSPVQKIWKRKDVLTHILVDYIEKNNITQVFDFTARQDYRETINWEKIRETSTVRHCFSKLGAGNDALEDDARFFREQAPGQLSHTLMNLDLDQDPSVNLNDYLYTRSLPEEWDGFPKERKSIPLEKGVLNLGAIPDFRTRQIFITAEQMLKVIYNLESVGDDAGSIFYVLYGKGLEVMLDTVITKKLRSTISKKYPNGRIPNFSSLPPALKGSLRSLEPRSISLGSWKELIQRCNESSHPVAQIFLQQITAAYGTEFPLIAEAANRIAEMRNPGAHSEIKTIDDFLDKRKQIIDSINRIIPLVYPAPETKKT